MADQTVYHAQGLCKYTGLERLHRRHVLPNGHVIRVYLDNFRQHRIVVFKSHAHKLGYAGLCLDVHGYTRHFECAPAMQIYNVRQVLCNYCRSIGIHVESEKMTIHQWQIDSFIRGYLVAALWSSTDTLPPADGEEEGDDVSLDKFEWASGEAEKLHADCVAFITTNIELCKQYASRIDNVEEYGNEWDYMGHDFWLTRNGHGAGFWDRGLGDLGRALTDASKAFSGVDLYLGDDQLVHVYGV